MHSIFAKAHRRERERMGAVNRPASPDAAARIALVMGRQLAGLVRLLRDLGLSPATIRRAVVAAHRAGLRRLIKHDPNLAVEVADLLREGIDLMLSALDDAIAVAALR